LAIGSAFAVLAAVGTASAQQSTSNAQQGAGAGQGTPGAQQTMNTGAPGGMPRADQPLLPPDTEPVFGFEGGAGILGYLGGTASVGPVWEGRVRAHFTPSWAVEATYLGAANDRQDNDATMVTTQIDASVRYDAFRSYNLPVQPFVTAGVGYAGFAGDDGDMAAVVIPLGIGADRALTRNIRLGARFNFRPVFGEDLATPEDRVNDEDGPGGDTWSIAAHLGGQF
jgi:hypothetical protein